MSARQVRIVVIGKLDGDVGIVLKAGPKDIVEQGELDVVVARARRRGFGSI